MTEQFDIHERLYRAVYPPEIIPASDKREIQVCLQQCGVRSIQWLNVPTE